MGNLSHSFRLSDMGIFPVDRNWLTWVWYILSTSFSKFGFRTYGFLLALVKSKIERIKEIKNKVRFIVFLYPFDQIMNIYAVNFPIFFLMCMIKSFLARRNQIHYSFLLFVLINYLFYFYYSFIQCCSVNCHEEIR